MKKTFLSKPQIYALASLLTVLAAPVRAATEKYVLDTEKAHATIQFKIRHVGFSWIVGRFDRFNGGFELDTDKPENSKVSVDVDVGSVDTNEADRDKHLRSADFFDVAKYPRATFVSTKIEKTGEKTANITGDFTLKGVTKPVTLAVTFLAGGTDPWGGYRQAFEASGEITLKDFGINYDLGPLAQKAYLYISAEGIRQ